MPELNPDYWNNRYRQEDATWDVGSITTPLKIWFDQLQDPSARILIPGCGNSYEAEYLHNKHFDHVNLVDYSADALDSFKRRVPGFPAQNLFCEDFFAHRGTYDYIIEQTFFCALDPSLRKAYAEKCNSLLDKGGKLVGLLFDAPLNTDKPPFGGTKEEYLKYFEPLFVIKTLDICHNSIAPRAGREFFVQLIKK